MAKVLVVTGAPWVRDKVVGALERSGVEVDTTDDPYAVEDLLPELEPDVVVVDSQVGSMGLMAICKVVRSEEAAGSIGSTNIIALLDRRADTFLARRADADAWLVKPLDPAALRWTFEVLSRPGAQWDEDSLAAELAGESARGAVLMEAAHEVADETAAADAEAATAAAAET
ncbi:MAG: response regulator [Acidimicrobiia bacterium]|nr:response regulator [Acidimicrobiia bacterium]